jgi:hypothetical protein
MVSDISPTVGQYARVQCLLQSVPYIRNTQMASLAAPGGRMNPEGLSAEQDE